MCVKRRGSPNNDKDFIRILLHNTSGTYSSQRNVLTLELKPNKSMRRGTIASTKKSGKSNVREFATMAPKVME
jgi:hypothetical protein